MIDVVCIILSYIIMTSLHHFPIHQSLALAVKFNSQSNDFALVALEWLGVAAVANLLFGSSDATAVG